MCAWFIAYWAFLCGRNSGLSGLVSFSLAPFMSWLLIAIGSSVSKYIDLITLFGLLLNAS